MHGYIFVSREMYHVGNFRSSLPGDNNKEDGGTPANTPVDRPHYHTAAPRSGVRTAVKLHHAGACYV